MTDRSVQSEWDETWKLFTSLWPTAKDMTRGQTLEWEARLRYRNQGHVRGAIRNVYSKVKFPRNPPALDAVMNECHNLSQSARVSQRVPIRTVTDENWYEIQREADSVRLILKSLPPADLQCHKKTACEAMALIKGFNRPKADKHAVAQQEQVVKGMMEGLTDDPMRWNPVFVLCVNAAMVASRLKSEISQPEFGRSGAAQQVSTVPPTPADFDEASIPF